MHRPLDAAASTDGQPGASKQSERPVEAQSGSRVGADGPDYLVLSIGTGELESADQVPRMPRTGAHFAGLGHSSTLRMTAAATPSTCR